MMPYLQVNTTFTLIFGNAPAIFLEKKQRVKDRGKKLLGLTE
jgi:hypothetical protein